MTAPTGPASDSAPLTRGERMARDVMHTLLIDSKPWVEIQANRREVIRASFENLDAADDFEGMLAAQMAIVHSIFLGTAWLSLDRARPEKDKAFYLRQAGQLMRLYRQGFDPWANASGNGARNRSARRRCDIFAGKRSRRRDEGSGGAVPGRKQASPAANRRQAISPRMAEVTSVRQRAEPQPRSEAVDRHSKPSHPLLWPTAADAATRSIPSPSNAARSASSG